MILVLKKIICLIAVLTVVFSFTVTAKDEFLVYGEDDTEQLCQILKMDENDISAYCKENNITYLAVNADNTKQIRRIEVADKFSQEVMDLSLLKDSEILSLKGELSGFEDVEAKVVKQADYKLLKVELLSNDSGGKYVLTQYTTVKAGKRIVLVFLTEGDSDRGYINDVLATQFKAAANYKPYVIIGVALFAFVGLVVLALIIKDLRKEKVTEENE